MKILGICGGNGVILHPFKKYLVGNVEPRAVFHTQNNTQWKLNFGNIPMYKGDLPDIKVNVIIGAPDCGHSSVLSYSRAKKLSNPANNKSLSLYIKAIKKYKPKIFLMENLDKALKNYPSLLNTLQENYDCITLIKSVSYWGNSQKTRIRLIIVGVRKNHKNGTDLLSKLNRVPKIKNLKNTQELLEGLDTINIKLGNVREPYDYEIPLYYRGKRKMTTLKAKKLWNSVFKNKTRWEVNMDRMKNQPGVYRNLAKDLPKTVRKQNRQFNPVGDMLTPREIARIQGIPDSFKIHIGPDKLLYWINKGRATCAKTPPYEIGQWFHDILFN